MTSSEQPAGTHAKSRAFVAVLAILAPGLGHAFVGHTARGVAWAVVPVVVAIPVLAVKSIPLGALVLVLAGLGCTAYVASIIDAAAMAPSRHRRTSIAGVVGLAVAPVLIAVPFALLVRTTVVQAFKVPSGAMTPSIVPGDHLFVDMRVRADSIRRGEVIVFRHPEHPEQDFVKRVVAVSGDTLEVRDGRPILNGWEVPSCRVGPWRYAEPDGASHEGELYVEFLDRSAYLVFFEANALSSRVQGPFVAKDGELWVLGDNRHNSHDSRMWFGGEGAGVPPANVRGRAATIWFSAAPGPSRAGTDVHGDPIAPSADLAAPLAQCLAERPTPDKASPPSNDRPR